MFKVISAVVLRTEKRAVGLPWQCRLNFNSATTAPLSRSGNARNHGKYEMISRLRLDKDLLESFGISFLPSLHIRTIRSCCLLLNCISIATTNSCCCNYCAPFEFYHLS